MEKKKNYLLLVLRGCAMGAADVIPGVSGGTIAFITGIYEELIESIRSINPPVIHLVLFLWSHHYFCPHGFKRNKKMGYTNHHLVNRWRHHRVHDHGSLPNQYSE